MENILEYFDLKLVSVDNKNNELKTYINSDGYKFCCTDKCLIKRYINNQELELYKNNIFSVYNMCLYIKKSTNNDVTILNEKELTTTKQTIEMYSKKYDITWTKLFCNIKNHGAYPKGYYARAGRDNEYYKTMKEKYLNTKINFLTIIDVIKYQGKIDNRKSGIYFLCKCDCGKVKTLHSYEVISGKVMSCGHYHNDCLSKNAAKYASYNNYRKYKWYFVKDGEKTRCRSSYEVIYANYLIENKINFEYEPKTFHLGDCRSYTPDFHLIDTDEWVEVKGNIYGEHQKENMNLFSKNHKFKMIFWQDLSVMCGFTHPNYIRYCKRRNIDVVEYLANKDYY